MNITETSKYKQAFIRYLRKGGSIGLPTKDAVNPHHEYYVWQTAGDQKVRPSHAANDGRIFSWDNPPPTGNPGEDFGCRCTAAPFLGEISSLVDDPPIDPVYPESLIIPLLRGGRLLWNLAVSLLRNQVSSAKIEKPVNFTAHGTVRSQGRRVSIEEAEEGIKSAQRTGKVTEKIGKYGTRQKHYEGSNGVKVIVETEGRNAGKIITFWKID